MWFENLFLHPGVAHSVLLLALTIALGLALSRVKIGGVSLGVTWVLFVGIVASHFGLVLDATTSHFVKEFGLILFIYSIGMQVGPSFFSSFRKGGITLNLLATCIVLLGATMAYVIHIVTGEDLFAMIGVLYGAVTNTPGLGAAQQTYSDLNNGASNSIFAQGYAVAYPLGVVGIILSIVLLRLVFRINMAEEQRLYEDANTSATSKQPAKMPEVNNENLISAHLVITNTKMQGKRLGDLDLRQTFHVSLARVKRAGIDLEANRSLILQLGDRMTVVGSAHDVKEIEKLLGNSVRRLDQPMLFATFLGIALGVLLGSLPIFFPGMPVPVKLGLAGGPLIVSILLSCYGPKFHLITYTTNSAKLLMREIGICMFMAAVGLGAGSGFVDTVMDGGYWWVFYGFLITFVPCMLVGILARVVFKNSYFTIAGMISGAMTDPPALAYSNSICGNDQASVAYSTVYPLTMFLRVLIAQILVLINLC